MKIKELDEQLNNKISQNSEIITFSFFELRVKDNLTEEETKSFVKLASIKLKNLKYELYYTGDNYVYNGEMNTVNDNQLLVAIKRK